MELDAGSGNATFVLTQDGEVISGTYSGVLGDDLEVSGEATENGVEFWFDSPASKVTYKGQDHRKQDGGHL